MPTTTNVIELSFEDRGGQVRVIPPDKDIMAMPIETAIQACRAFKDQIVFHNQFGHLLDYLANWLVLRKDKVDRAFVTTRDAGLLFLVVTKSKSFDANFEAELTDLDLDVANDSDFHLISFSVLAIPNVSEHLVGSFLSKNLALRYRMNGD